MWLFFFHDSEHKLLSHSLAKLMSKVKERYAYTKWTFKPMDSITYQVLDGEGDEQGFIVWTEIV